MYNAATVEVHEDAVVVLPAVVVLSVDGVNSVVFGLSVEASVTPQTISSGIPVVQFPWVKYSNPDLLVLSIHAESTKWSFDLIVPSTCKFASSSQFVGKTKKYLKKFNSTTKIDHSPSMRSITFSFKLNP